jgi:glycosyltransferase involved in cell wall biosynthesis
LDEPIWVIKRKMDNNLPLVTIITVCFNAAEHLEKTLLSVINQDYPNIEYIVIDGGSKDGTQEIIKKYENEITYWISEKDNGVFDAMNKGINISKGIWLNFMNAGDTFVTINVISSLNLHQHHNVALLYGNRTVDNKLMTYPFPIESLKYGMIMACHQAMFFNRLVIGEKQLYYTNEFKWYCEYDLVCRVYNNNLSFQYCDVTVVDYLAGGLSYTFSNDARKAKYTLLYRHFGFLGILKGGLERLRILKLPKPIQPYKEI